MKQFGQSARQETGIDAERAAAEEAVVDEGDAAEEELETNSRSRRGET
ncbi:hypothetical protein [Salinarchaeum laminariae]|nr:hypothetical protein [Salinarchaeum laminariae]